MDLKSGPEFLSIAQWMRVIVIIITIVISKASGEGDNTSIGQFVNDAADYRQGLETSRPRCVLS